MKGAFIKWAKHFFYIYEKLSPDALPNITTSVWTSAFTRPAFQLLHDDYSLTIIM